MSSSQHVEANRKLIVSLVVVAVMTATQPAFAQQLNVGQSMLSMVITWLGATAVLASTIAFMHVGYRMMFAAAKWADVAPVFWGSVLIGGAGAVAATVAS